MFDGNETGKGDEGAGTPLDTVSKRGEDDRFAAITCLNDPELLGPHAFIEGGESDVSGTSDPIGDTRLFRGDSEGSNGTL